VYTISPSGQSRSARTMVSGGPIEFFGLEWA